MRVVLHHAPECRSSRQSIRPDWHLRGNQRGLRSLDEPRIFREIPSEIRDAALVDGCSHFGAFLRVGLRTARGGIAATAILTALYIWNEFLFALILTSTERAMTMPVAVTLFIRESGIGWGNIGATAVIMFLPMFLMTLAVQRYIVSAVSLLGKFGVSRLIVPRPASAEWHTKLHGSRSHYSLVFYSAIISLNPTFISGDKLHLNLIARRACIPWALDIALEGYATINGCAVELVARSNVS